MRVEKKSIKTRLLMQLDLLHIERSENTIFDKKF